MTHRLRVLAGALCFTCTFWLPSLASARSADEVSRIMVSVSNEIYSPFCPGKNLHMCTSPNAAAVRREIQEMAQKGLDGPEIKQTILDQYGEEFRFVEPPAGDNVGLGVALGVGFLGAIGLIVFISRRRVSATGEPEEPVGMTLAQGGQEDESSEEDEYLKELRDEV